MEDMKELLGTSSGEEDEALSQMWKDGMIECSCPLGHIAYDDFRMFVKGQKKEREPDTPKRKSAGRKSLEGSPSLLQVVPEGTISPQVKHQIFASFEEISALDNLKLPSLGVEVERKPKEVDIAFPTIPLKPVKRMRSRSLEEPSAAIWYEDEENMKERPPMEKQSSWVALPHRAIGELQQMINDESKTPLFVNKALYRKHREFRSSVLDASKIFDQKRQTRKLQQDMPSSRQSMTRMANLTMRRGSIPENQLEPPQLPSKSDHAPPPQLLPFNSDRALQQLPFSSDHERPQVPFSSEHERTNRVEDAAKRSGRPRRPRQKTTSDISGMLR
jgi:hypothetical protein